MEFRKAKLEKAVSLLSSTIINCEKMQLKFSDCTHTSEPNCAIQQAIGDGILSVERLESYRKLKREAEYDVLNSKQVESLKLNEIFSGVGGMKNARKYIKEKTREGKGSNMDIIIRQEIKSDSDKIYNVVKSAFENAEHTDHDEHNLVARLRKSKAFIPELSLVADQDGEIVGHIMFTKIKVGKHIALALAPLSVLPKMQSQGIGGKLIERGHEIAKELGFTLCVLLGHAMYYPRFGYIPASNLGIQAQFDVPDDAFMVKQLVVNTDISGAVKYPNEFFVNE